MVRQKQGSLRSDVYLLRQLQTSSAKLTVRIPKLFKSTLSTETISKNLRISSLISSLTPILLDGDTLINKRNTSFLCLFTSLASICSPFFFRSKRSIQAFILNSKIYPIDLSL